MFSCLYEAIVHCTDLYIATALENGIGQQNFNNRKQEKTTTKIAKTLHPCWFVSHSSFQSRVGIYSLYRGAFYVWASGLYSL